MNSQFINSSWEATYSTSSQEFRDGGFYESCTTETISFDAQKCCGEVMSKKGNCGVNYKEGQVKLLVDPSVTLPTCKDIKITQTDDTCDNQWIVVSQEVSKRPGNIVYATRLIIDRVT